MPKDRHQHGYVEEVGKRVKKWRGHFFPYVSQPDGAEKRTHRIVDLGKKAARKKWEAEAELQNTIDRETAGARVKPAPEFTLRWFWAQRYRPLREPTWKASSRPKTVRFVEHYVLGQHVAGEPGAPKLGDLMLGEVDRFTVQRQVNWLATRFSKSVVTKFRVYAHAIFDEALEQDFLTRNPARKIELPETRKQCSRALSEEEIAELLAELSGRDRLIVRMFLVLGLRPGELFALRRNDRIDPGQLRIDESVSEELHGADRTVDPKTEASGAYVWLPQSITTELDFWLEHMTDRRPEAFVFASQRGTPLNLNNFLNRVLRPAALAACKRITEKEGRELPAGFLERVNHQAFRRTCATAMQKHGTVKDVQAHLRHATPAMTIGVYMQEIPASVRAAVESLDRKLLEACGPDATAARRGGGVLQ